MGGAVRDTLAERTFVDVDLASPLPPETVMERLAAAGIKAVPTGLAHGTVTAVCPAEPSKSRHCAATSKPTDATPWSRSPTTGAATRRGGISPSTRCR